MKKKTVKRKYDRHFGIEPNDDELDFYFDLIDSAKEECAEDIQQAVRYYLKYQNYPMWEDQNEYQKGVQVTCENIEELIENDFINNKE